MRPYRSGIAARESANGMVASGASNSRRVIVSSSFDLSSAPLSLSLRG